MLASKKKSSATINIRVKIPQRDMIDLAAEMQGRSRSEFMIDVAYKAAQDILLDQSFFVVDESTFEQLNRLIETPLPATEKLKSLLKTKAPWEK